MNRLFTRHFFSVMLPLAIPIAFQSLLSASFRLVDTLMIGRLGDTAIASVGLAGNVSFLIELIALGLASGSTVFMAQYHGAGNNLGIRRSLSCCLCIAVPISLLLIFSALCFPDKIMALLTNDDHLITEGIKYLKYACISYMGIILGFIFSATIRSTEHMKLPVIASAISAIMNAIMNYVFIFGKFGLPAMGIAGAGLATSISSYISPIIMIVFSLAGKGILYGKMSDYLKIRGFFMTFFKKVSPVLLNEILWSLCIIGLNMVYGRMGDDNYAALTVYRAIENIGFVFFVGVCHSCDVVVGMRVGSQRIEEAKTLAKQYVCFVPLMGIVLGAMLFLLRTPILSLFDISDTAHTTALYLLMFYCLDVGIRNVPYILVVGVFRAGGDTKIGLFGDLFVNGLLVLPTAYILGLVLHLPFIITYICALLVDDVGKFIIYLPYFKSEKWIMPIKHD